jgi:hypothetical protein
MQTLNGTWPCRATADPLRHRSEPTRRASREMPDDVCRSTRAERGAAATVADTTRAHTLCQPGACRVACAPPAASVKPQGSAVRQGPRFGTPRRPHPPPPQRQTARPATAAPRNLAQGFPARAPETLPKGFRFKNGPTPWPHMARSTAHHVEREANTHPAP